MATEVLEILSLAESEGRQGLNRWIGERTELLHSNSQLVDSIYRRLKETSVGAALLFAVALRKRELLSPAVALDLETLQASNQHLWVTGVLHIMRSHILEKVRAAMEGGDVLFGWHSYYCGGGSPGTVLFTSFEDFAGTAERARPGDRFQLASLRQLTDQNGLLEPTLTAARQYLTTAPRGEVWVLRTGLKPPELEILWADNIGVGAAESWFYPSHGLYLAPVREDLEFDVTEYFVDAKKPDAQGAVPLGGAY
jgi:hypothetical protein